MDSRSPDGPTRPSGSRVPAAVDAREARKHDFMVFEFNIVITVISANGRTSGTMKGI